MPGLLGVGYVFLYAPIALLVAASFNPSRLTTVLTGFSLRWYGVLWHDQALLEAAALSIRVAALSATGAAALGLAAGYALARFGRFAGRSVFSALVAARLVLPDVLVGLSLLLLFVQVEAWLGWPKRGALTITLAHVSVSLSYVAVVVEARLADQGTELEEAAMDLGASPWGRVPAGDAAIAGARAARGMAARVHALARRPRGRELRVRAGRLDASDGGVLGAQARADPGAERARDGDPRAGGRGGGVGAPRGAPDGAGRTALEHNGIAHFPSREARKVR